jgi:hypothetical protein
MNDFVCGVILALARFWKTIVGSISMNTSWQWMKMLMWSLLPSLFWWMIWSQVCNHQCYIIFIFQLQLPISMAISGKISPYNWKCFVCLYKLGLCVLMYPKRTMCHSSYFISFCMD